MVVGKEGYWRASESKDGWAVATDLSSCPRSNRGGHSKRFCLRFWRDSGLILHRIGGVKFGPSLTTPLCSEGILDAILHVDGSGWLVQAEAEAEAAILEPNAPPESLLQKRRF